jgi:hypothetical protein
MASAVQDLSPAGMRLRKRIRSICCVLTTTLECSLVVDKKIFEESVSVSLLVGF